MQMMQMTTRTAIHPLKMVAALVALVAAMAVVLTYNASPARAAAKSCSTTAGITTCTFSPTGAEDTFVVPAEVSSVHVVATGAPGSLGDFGDSAGRGARVSGDLTGLVAGQTLYVNVGGAATGERGESGGFNGGGSSGHYGGGGGGASDVRTEPRTVPLATTDSRLIVAGGGGGSGTNLGCTLPDDSLFLTGGAGGNAGSDGGNGEPCGSLAGGTGGKAGTQSEGGLGGSPDGQNGSLGQGGGAVLFGGGGGGGYYGGGGGGDQTSAGSSSAASGGGGGGSSLVPTGGSGPIITSNGPSITISYATPHTVVVDRTDDPDLSTTPSAGACTVAANDCSLRGAINAANANSGDDTIYLLGVSGTVNLTGALPALSSNIKIEGPGADQLTLRRDSGGDYRIFTVTRGSVVSISGITISNGKTSSSSGGGGVYNDGGTLTISGSTITNNSTEIASSGGAGIYNNRGALTVSGSTISGNSSSGDGGGIVSLVGTLTISGSTISGNSALSGIGGGVFVDDGTILMVTNSSFSGNSTFEGGGIGIQDSTATITNSTFSGNSASRNGGGVFNQAGLSVIENSTITKNTAPSGRGSGVASWGDDRTHTEVLSTIISANTNTDVDFVAGTTNSFLSEGYNLIGGGNAIGDNDPTTDDNAFDQSGDQTGVSDPQLGSLADNGGPTETHALLAGSPAIDKGNSDLSTDQRGEVRRFDDPGIAPATGGDDSDIGSFEAQEVLNRAPDAKDDDATTNEDTPLSVDVLSNVTDPDGDAPQLTGVGTPAHGTATINDNGTPADRTDDLVTYTPNADYNGGDSFTYTVSDGKGGADTATLNIKVSAVNDAPSFTKGADQTVNEDAPAQSISNWATGIAPGPATATDESTQGVSFVVSNDNNGLFSTQPAVSSNGTLTYTLAADKNGSATVTVYAKDDGGTPSDTSDDASSASQTFPITVKAVNDAPKVEVAAATSCGTNDRSGTITLSVSDVDSPVAGLTLAGNSNKKDLVPNANLAFAGTGTASPTLTATTLSGKTGAATITVTVSDADKATGAVALTLKAGGNSNDTLLGTPNTDILLGQNGDDTLSGLGGKDLLCGGLGNDNLSGGADEDTLSGGSGNDRFTGGIGADFFSGGTGTDKVADFTPSQGDTKNNTIP